jgi:hypothetical protein
MKLRTVATPKPKPQPTSSFSSPRKGNRTGCLCRNKNTYSQKCCDKSMGAQGIGLIYPPAKEI